MPRIHEYNFKNFKKISVFVAISLASFYFLHGSFISLPQFSDEFYLR